MDINGLLLILIGFFLGIVWDRVKDIVAQSKTIKMSLSLIMDEITSNIKQIESWQKLQKDRGDDVTCFGFGEKFQIAAWKLAFVSKAFYEYSDLELIKDINEIYLDVENIMDFIRINTEYMYSAAAAMTNFKQNRDTLSKDINTLKDNVLGKMKKVIPKIKTAIDNQNFFNSVLSLFRS